METKKERGLMETNRRSRVSMRKKNGAGPHVLEDFKVPDKWEK